MGFTMLLSIFVCPVKAQVVKSGKTPIIVVTDLYHPYQDPGDNFDLITGFAMPELDLKAVILDITGEFLKKEGNAFNVYIDKEGPREAGFIPVLQLNYIFNKSVPCAVGPMNAMRSEKDLMTDIPAFQQEGINLLLNTLRTSERPIDIISTGSARTIAVACNREPELFRKKVRMIHLSAGSSANKIKNPTGTIWDNIPGGEWNTALDVFGMTRLLRSGLPVSIYACAGRTGVFGVDEYNTFWLLTNIEDFITQMNPKLQQFLSYAFLRKSDVNFLTAMDKNEPFTYKKAKHNVWETAVWINAAQRELVQTKEQLYRIIPKSSVKATDRIIKYEMQPCRLKVYDDGKFEFDITTEKTNTTIYYRINPAEHEKALQQALPALYISFDPE
jgi:hypothetical protein